jgi:uncharacterized membrane protein YpjA
VFLVFFVGGAFFSAVIDALVVALFLLLDKTGYASQLAEVGWVLWNDLPNSPGLSHVLIFALLFYVKPQFLNALIAVLIFCFLRRLSFWAMIVAVPFIAYTFDFSFAVDWLWQGHSVLEPARILALAVMQLCITLTCLRLVGRPLTKALQSTLIWPA